MEGLPFKAVNPNLRKYGACLRGKVMIVEGLISAGKSTAGTELEKFAHDIGIPCRLFPEPLIEGFLGLFLQDQPKYAFAFQIGMLVKRQAIYREAFELAKQGYFCIIDRSLHGDYCFAMMHKNSGNISDAEWKAYLEVLHSEQFEHPDYVIYLETTPENAFKRCISRARKGENTYTLKYFQELFAVYRSVIPASPSKNILVIDWNEDRSKDHISEPILAEIKRAYETN
jgi:deoxyadenosine/deoxycytidine kinase